MRGTSVNLTWREGVEMGSLISAIEAFAARHGLSLMPPGGKKPDYLPPWGRHPYSLKWYLGNKFETIEADHVALNPPFPGASFAGVYWELYDPAGELWFSMSILGEAVVRGRVFRLHLSFDETYAIGGEMRPEEVPAGIKKYHQFKELYHLLDADVLYGGLSGVVESDAEDPEFGTQSFRFAKQGRQILNRPMEERRAPRPDDLNYRMVIDPPSSSYE